MARWRGSRLRWAIAGLLVVVLVAAVIVAWPLVQRYTGAAPPAQFYEKVELDPALTGDYPHVFGVAHNAGNNLGTLAAALRYGADVVEIDVISARPARGGPRPLAALAGRAAVPGTHAGASVGSRCSRQYHQARSAADRPRIAR
jgi:hypothetical protein